jgi:hypothetical protein
MARLPASGARIDTPRRTEGELKRVFRNLGVGKVFDENAAGKVYWKLARIIGQWSREQERLEVSPIVEALRSIANNLSDASRLLSGLESGLRSSLEIAVASQVAKLLSMDPTLGSQSASQLLGSFRVEADRIAHACLVAANDLLQISGERGRPAHNWYDEFTALLLQIADKAGIEASLRKDRITGMRSGWLLDAALALESFLDPAMRSPSAEACGKRLERRIGGMRRTKRQNPPSR